MESGGQPGNQNATKGKRWLNAINKALENRCKSDGQKALVCLAEKMLEAADKGEQWAINHLADRLDGKPSQSLALGNDPDNPLIPQPLLPQPSKEECQKIFEDFKAKNL